MKAVFREERSGRQGARMYFDIKPMNKTNRLKPVVAMAVIMFTIIAVVPTIFSTAGEQDFGGTELSVKVDNINKAVKVSVRTPKINTVQFYMFNVEGKLVKQYEINGPKKFVIDRLENGIYMYDFFSSDQRLKTGKIELK